MQIINVTQKQLLADKAQVADTFFTRLKGLLGTKGLPDGAGLVIKPCDSVHTFWMRYAIDVLFVGSGDEVLKTAADLRPGKVAMCRKSRYVIELPAGTLAKTGTQAGDRLELTI